MPYGNRTGPMGMGPMTGRAAGFCAGFGMPGYANPTPGGGMGFGRGRGFRGGGGGGRGWRHGFNATGQPGWMRFGGYDAPYGYSAPYQKLDPELERQALESQLQALQTELENINKRLSEIKADSSAH